MSEESAGHAPAEAIPSAGASGVEPRPRATLLRLVALVLFVLAVLWLAYALGLRERFEAEALRATIGEAGALGYLVFAVAFLVGQVLYVPGMIFVAVAVFLWGPVQGFLLGYGVGNLGVNLHFLLLRWIGGRPLVAGAPGLRARWMRRQLEGLERHPLRVVFLLRSVAFMAPALNTFLALTRLRARDHLIGTALGLLLPIAAAAGLFQWIFS